MDDKEIERKIVSATNRAFESLNFKSILKKELEIISLDDTFKGVGSDDLQKLLRAMTQAIITHQIHYIRATLFSLKQSGFFEAP